MKANFVLLTLVVWFTVAIPTASAKNSAQGIVRKPAEAVPGTLASYMGKMQGLMTFFPRGLATIATDDAVLKSKQTDVASWKQYAAKCRTLVPDDVNTDERKARFQALFDRLDANLKELGDAVDARNSDRIKAALEAVKETEKLGHRDFT